jgi:arylsulfatase A-like enzyme
VNHRSLWLASIAIAVGFGCGRASESAPSPASSGGSLAPDAPAQAVRPSVLDVVKGLDACALGHRGVLLDFGDPSMLGRLRPGSLSRGDDEVVEHGGATWLRVRARALNASFYWPAVANETPDANAYVEARINGLSGRGVVVTIDGKSVGKWALAKGEARILVARAPTPVTLAPGGHELGLRFVGGSRAGDALAEIDWVHVGTGDSGPTYAAPTRADALLDATVGGQSLRALSLHAPAFVRCSGWIPANATLEASLATTGGGDADVEARVLRDRRPPVVLGTAHVAGNQGGWAPWSVPITGLEGEGALASIELVARRAGQATRVLFGTPQIIATQSLVATSPPPARGVLLVVLGNTSAKSLAPWGGPHVATNLSKLSSSGALFTANRASSSLATAVLASMLTGMSPHSLGLEDAGARLPQGPTTTEEACRQAGIATAMFTANPTTGGAFGFDRGWGTFVLHDPLEEEAATRVFDEAAAWIEAHPADRFLVVVHARGGHPPWDVTPDELKVMPPAGYFGIIEPRRAAEALAKAHRRASHFKEEDRVRAWSLYDRAVDAHDEALGRLLSALRGAGRERDTGVIVTGDVAASEATPVPFIDTDTLDEPLLATPLVVRWPNADALAGRVVDAPTSPQDLARTVVSMLALAPPPTFEGVDLASVAQGALVPAQRPLAATYAGRFAVRWGPFVLVGAREREIRMCDLTLDPTCVADVRATSPLALEPLHRWAIETLTPVTRPPFPREPAILDQRTAAALVRWGRAGDRDSEEGL